MTPYASYPLTRELPPISNRRLRFFGVAAGLCVALGLNGPFFVVCHLSDLVPGLHLAPLEKSLGRSELLLAWVCGFPAFCTSVALCLASFRRHCTKEAGYRLVNIAFVATVAAIGGWVLVHYLNKGGADALLIGLLVGFVISFIAILSGAFFSLVPALVSVGPVVAVLNRREAAALRRAQRRYFDGREKQLLAKASPTPWRETRKGFHTIAALCGLICTIGLTAAAGLIEFAIHGSSIESGLAYAVLTLLVWPALVVCIGAKILGCGGARSWNDGIPLAVGAYVWSVATFSLGALLVAVVNESYPSLILALHFGVACAMFGAALSLLPCFIAITCCAYVDDPARARAKANLLQLRRRP